MLIVSELRNSKLPKQFIALLPTQCPKCGYPTEITETLSILKCTNKNCVGKPVQRAVMMMAELGIKNLGESKLEDFFETWKQTSPYALFAFYKGWELGSAKKLGSKMSESFTSNVMGQFEGKMKMALWEFVRMGNLPNIKDSARKLLQNYDNLEKFYGDIEEQGVNYIQELLGIKTLQTVVRGTTPVKFMAYLSEHGVRDASMQSLVINTFISNYTTLENTLKVMDEGTYNHDDLYVKNQWIDSHTVQKAFHGILRNFVDELKQEKEVTSIKALDVYKTLLEHKEELITFVKYFMIEKVQDERINICISTSVGYPYQSKSDFVSKMKQKYEGKIQINYLSSVTKDCNILICSNQDSPTSKLQKALKLQEQGHGISIMSGKEFDDYLETTI